MKMTSKGQVTIPLSVRESLGWEPATELIVETKGNSVVLKKAKGNSRGKMIVEHLRGKAKGGWTTDEIMKLSRG